MTIRAIATLFSLTVLPLTVPGLLSACGGPQPAVTYERAGSFDEGVWLIEERGSETRRQYIVLCHPRRTPPCARVRPRNAASQAALASWVATEREVPRSGPSVDAAALPAIVTPGAPVVTDAPTVAPAEGTEELPAQPATTSVGDGHVAVITPGGWATVYDDAGRFLGETPLRVQMPAGDHILRFRPYGHAPRRNLDVRIRVAAGQTVRVVRALNPEP